MFHPVPQVMQFGVVYLGQPHSVMHTSKHSKSVGIEHFAKLHGIGNSCSRVMQKKRTFEFLSGRPLEMCQYVKKICAEISVNLDKN